MRKTIYVIYFLAATFVFVFSCTTVSNKNICEEPDSCKNHALCHKKGECQDYKCENDKCPKEYVCNNNICLLRCDNSNNCPSGSHCNEKHKACFKDGISSACKCKSNNDCKYTGWICKNCECILMECSCLSDQECNAGDTCNGCYCVASP